MFTVKHASKDGKTYVSSCESYDIDKANRSIVMHYLRSEDRTIHLAPGETVFLENMNGKTCDVVR